MAVNEGQTKEKSEIQAKLAELREIYAKVEDRIKLDEETAARFNKPSKMGATLKSQNELQEWLEK